MQTGINEPRYATLRAIKQAREKPLEVLGLDGVGLDAGTVSAAAGSRLVSLAHPERGGGAEILDGDAAAVAARIVEIVRDQVVGMSGVLVIAETRQGVLREVSLELVSAAVPIAAELGAGVKVAVIGADPSSFAASLAVEGVGEVLTVQAPCEVFEAAVWGRALEALIEVEAPSLVLLGHTIDSMGFAPAVAARGQLGFATDVTGFSLIGGALRARRGAYGDKLVAELEFPGKSCVVVDPPRRDLPGGDGEQRGFGGGAGGAGGA